MGFSKSLFDDDYFMADEKTKDNYTESKKEVLPLDRLKNLEEKISTAVERVKSLKEEKISLEKRIRELENLLNEKNQEIESLRSEKTTIKNQVEELLSELETLEL